MFTIKQRKGSLINLRKQQFNKKITLSTKFQNPQKQSSILPKIRYTPNMFDVKKKQKNQAKQLALAIENFNLRKIDNKLEIRDQFVFDILSVLQQFSMVQNNFQQLFADLYRQIKKFIFLQSDAQLTEKYQIKEGQLFKNACKIIDKKVHKQLKANIDKIARLNQDLQQKTLEFKNYKEQSSQIQKTLKDQINRFKQITNSDYVYQIQEKLERAKQKIYDLQTSEINLTNLRNILEKQIEELNNKDKEHIQEIAKLNAKIFDLNAMRGKNQAAIIKIRDRFDQINMKLLGIRQTISSVQQENENLKTQRVKLIKRAAVSFEQLTPRPKYNKVFQFTQSEVILNSTVDIVQKLFDQIFCSSTLSKQKFFKKHLKQREVGKNQQLMNMDKIRQKIGDDIIQSKKDLQIVLDTVKKQY